MSVIIKGFKMPSGCAYCDLNNDSRCSALGMLPDEGNGLTRRKECPLEELPMSDLISRQAAIEAVERHYRAHDNDLLELIAHEIDRLPSVEPDFSCDGCQTPKHICGICMRNYPNITDHYCTGEAWREAKDETD